MTIATALAPKIRMTLSEYEAIDPKLRYELIEGALIEMAPPSEEHGGVGYILTQDMANLVRKERLGMCFLAETRFIIDLSRDTALAPDWAFISTDRLPNGLSKKYSRIVPDAVIEIRSPSDRASEVRKKMELWIEAGVRIGWEFNPDTEIMTVYRPNCEPKEIGLDEIVSGEDVLPGFEMTLRKMLE